MPPQPRKSRGKLNTLRAKAHTYFAMTIYTEPKPEIGDRPFSYLCGVRETCPKTGKLHWQCTVVPTNAMTYTAAQGHWKPHHIEAPKQFSCFEASRVYCTIGKGKDPPDTTGLAGTEFEEGERPVQGKRTDLDAMCKEFLENGYDALTDAQILKWQKHLAGLAMIRYKPVNREVNVMWFYGPTRSGKSFEAVRTLKKLYGDNGVYSRPTKGDWFDMYTRQQGVLIDDYDGEFSLGYFLRLTDKYPCLVPTKGGHVYLQALTIIFTSHAAPATFFTEERWPEVAARLSHIHEFEPTVVPLRKPIMHKRRRLEDGSVEEVVEGECPVPLVCLSEASLKRSVERPAGVESFFDIFGNVGGDPVLPPPTS